jgi:hypothetical protein
MTADLRAAARALGGEVSGRQILAPGPGHSPSDRSLSVRFDASAPDGFVVHSFCDDDWSLCRDHVRALFGISSNHGERERCETRTKPRAPPEPDEEERRRAAFVREQIAAIAREFGPIRGTLGERYLREVRGIDTEAIADVLERTDAIAWHPSLYFNQADFSKPHHEFHGRRLGGIVALLTDSVTARFAGAITRTYLDDDGRKVGKAKTLAPADLPRPLRGIVRLSRDEDVLEGLIIVEGIETGLALMAAGMRPVWATGSTSDLASFPILPGIECLTIVADHDEKGAGERAAHEVEARWRAGRREVRIFIRNRLGDFNDALRDAEPGTAREGR